MKNKLKHVTVFFVLICISLLFTSCGGINKTEYTAKSNYAVSTFNDIFVSFSELKNTCSELLNERPSEQWWIKFHSVYADVGAIQRENRLLMSSNNLSEVDNRLSSALTNIIRNYNDGFEVMNAAYGNQDSEIVDFAFNEFSSKLSTSNLVWDIVVSEVATQMQ